MKRRKLIKHLEANGCVKDHEGGKHTIYFNPATGMDASVPRHEEIRDSTAYLICKQLGVSKPKSK